ncbi:MAG TPA: three-Cys-motif partner protein TcmP [Verrucomicrobiae bacterium]|nr:three-Cys-motif partner protein TcmP [Verrucomicrobiae bacterium]
MAKERLDVVGYWTEIKLQILQDYAKAYAQVLQNQHSIKHVAYIDGFAGAGEHISRESGELIAGSPARALSIQPRFSHYHFVEMDAARAKRLHGMGDQEDVTVYQGDCNEVLLQEIFPQCRYKDYRRALCLLDPYDLNPNWEVVETAGKMGSIEIFLNFMIMDANMNVLWNKPESVPPDQAQRMTKFWGDDSWRAAAYRTEQGLFGPIEEKGSNESVIAAYRKRLKEVAKFKYVPEPLPMRNSRGAIVYYLFFASQNSTGNKIAEHIFNKYRNRGVH